MKFVKNLFLFIASTVLLNAQINIELIEQISFPTEFKEVGFNPDHFNISATGIYYLDSESRQIAFVDNCGKVVFAGGYGVGMDASIDPIDIISSKLRTWVVDGTENQLIEFDHRLNYLRTIDFETIYPNKVGIDNWGNIYLYSDLEQKIFKINPTKIELDEHIDLIVWDELNNCITEMLVTPDGEIVLLSPCSERVYMFNRLGQLFIQYSAFDSTESLLIKLMDDWLIVNKNGILVNLQSGKSINLPIPNPILDTDQKGQSLYLLTSEAVWKFNVESE